MIRLLDVYSHSFTSSVDFKMQSIFLLMYWCIGCLCSMSLLVLKSCFCFWSYFHSRFSKN